MPTQPTLHTERLTLRPFGLADANTVQQLAGAYQVALNTSSIPHPYPDGGAEMWIGTHQAQFDAGDAVHFAITRQNGEHLIGAMGLAITREHRRAELGYWIGVPHWGQGYATEAARAVLAYGFEETDLLRITATHFGRNPASGRVMQKIGMTNEGCLRQHILRWGEPQDLVLYGVLVQEWRALSGATAPQGASGVA
jgi:[ribosomal protein S5]-alanine N-acetyltransferase